jgi:maltooligosyltrehalose trehalohydrolase
MPVADFPGRRGWGYDGVLLFAPEASYGRPDDLKRPGRRGARAGLMVLLDVVYNHFGPDGNYLHVGAGPSSIRTPPHALGRGLNLRCESRHGARFLHPQRALLARRSSTSTACAWMPCTPSSTTRRRRISSANWPQPCATGPGRTRARSTWCWRTTTTAAPACRDADGRHALADAQWNDDFHHALHVLLTGESDGYYATSRHAAAALFGARWRRLRLPGRSLALPPWPPRGEASRHLPPNAFVAFLQTHDQIGNRAFGERLCQLAEPQALRAAQAVLLLSPQPPLLFMGEEFAAATPFQFFCDFGGVVQLLLPTVGTEPATRRR